MFSAGVDAEESVVVVVGLLDFVEEVDEQAAARTPAIATVATMREMLRNFMVMSP
ncbi:MAG: hypothetical protein WCK41_06470 [Actinomycetes bacterium]